GRTEHYHVIGARLVAGVEPAAHADLALDGVQQAGRRRVDVDLEGVEARGVVELDRGRVVLAHGHRAQHAHRADAVEAADAVLDVAGEGRARVAAPEPRLVRHDHRGRLELGERPDDAIAGRLGDA